MKLKVERRRFVHKKGFSFSSLDFSQKTAYLENLVTKQLDLYSWCEEKVSTLATIDSILLGAATIFIDHFVDVNEVNRTISIILILLVLLPLFISLSIALWHIRPKMGRASNYGRPNHRSSNGIRHYKDADEYRKIILNLSEEELYEDLTRQIYGMNQNIWKNQQSIKSAVFCDLIGIFGFFIMIIYWAFQ